MMVLRLVNNKYPAHIYIVCETCKAEMDILNIHCYGDICEKQGWTKKNEHDANANNGEKYKLLHWCPKCSLEHQNK
jgi:hypothetical protein